MPSWRILRMSAYTQSVFKKGNKTLQTVPAQLKNALMQPLFEKRDTIIGQMVSDQFKSRFQLRVRAKITSQSSRSDLGWIWPI